VTLCPNCGHENEPGAKFCSQCAAALAERGPAARTERKVGARYVREGGDLLLDEERRREIDRNCVVNCDNLFTIPSRRSAIAALSSIPSRLPICERP